MKTIADNAEARRTIADALQAHKKRTGNVKLTIEVLRKYSRNLAIAEVRVDDVEKLLTELSRDYVRLPYARLRAVKQAMYDEQIDSEEDEIDSDSDDDEMLIVPFPPHEGIRIFRTEPTDRQLATSAILASGFSNPLHQFKA